MVIKKEKKISSKVKKKKSVKIKPITKKRISKTKKNKSNKKSKKKDSQKRIATGIKSFDKLISGGFVPKSVNLIEGGSGTGKSIFGAPL